MEEVLAKIEEESTEVEADYSISKRNDAKSNRTRYFVDGAVKGPSPLEDEYKMSHKHRGIALVFNHLKFNNLARREGTDLDRDRICSVLRSLQFDVDVHNNLTVQEVNDVLLNVSKMDHTTCDCFVIVMMSHGDERILYAKDESYPTKRLWQYFSANLCPTLAGKPKLFFIQACRGEGIDEGVTVSYSETDSKNGSEMTYSIPIMADILVMYSTVEGFYSWRDPDNGSFFIQALAFHLEQCAKEHKDLLSSLTRVNRDIAIGFTANVRGSQCKQMCSIVSMLTRNVYFNRK